MLRKTIKSWWVAHHLETWSKVPTKGTKRGQAPRDHGHSCLLGHTFQKLKPFPPKKLQCMKNSFSFPREQIDAILTSPCMSFPFSRFSLHLPSVVGTVNDILLLSTKVLWMNDIIRGEVWCSLRYFWPFGISKNATCKFSICRSNTRGLQLSGPAPERGAIAGIGQNWELRISIMDVKVPPWGVPWHIGLGSHPTHYPSRAHLVFYLYNGPLLGHLKRYLISALSRNWDPIFLGILSLP